MAGADPPDTHDRRTTFLAPEAPRLNRTLRSLVRSLRARTRASAQPVGAAPVASDPCPLCLRVHALVVSEQDGKTGEPLRVVACATCGFVRQDPLPDPRALADFYRERYRVAYKGVSRPKLKHVWRAASLALERCAFLSDHALAGARVLDVGAGGGEFVSLLSRRGYQATGIEPNRGYAEFARECYGIDVRVGVLEDFEADEVGHDAITLFHVLEHVADPVATLRELRRRLVPGGTLVVEVPNVEYLRCAPTNMFFRAHVHYFSACTLLSAAALAGLSPVSPRPDPRSLNLRVAFRARDDAADAAGESATGGLVSSHAASPLARPTRPWPPAEPSGWPSPARRALRAQSLRTWWAYLSPRRSLPRLARRLAQVRVERGLGKRFVEPRVLLDAAFEGDGRTGRTARSTVTGR